MVSNAMKECSNGGFRGFLIVVIRFMNADVVISRENHDRRCQARGVSEKIEEPQKVGCA